MNLQNLVNYCDEMGLPSPFAGASVPAPLNLDTVLSAIMVRCGLLTPVYNDPDTFRNATTHWFTVKQWTFEHLINVIQAEYSPIENVYENRKEETTFGSSEIHTGGYKDTESGKDTVALSGTDTEAHSGTDTNALSGTDTEAHSGTDTEAHSGTDTTTNEISAFNSTGYQADNKASTLHGESIGTTHGESIGTTYGKSESLTHGESIGTTYGKSEDTTYGHAVTRSYQNDKNDHVGKDTFEVFRHGNIGVTTNQQMINEELELLRHFDIYGFIAELFENDNMIMIY